MIPGGQKDLDPNCATAPIHALRWSVNSRAGYVNCEVCGGEAPLEMLLDPGEDTPSTAAERDTEARDIVNGTKALNPRRTYKIIKAVVLWLAPQLGVTPTQARNQIANIYKDL